MCNNILLPSHKNAQDNFEANEPILLSGLMSSPKPTVLSELQSQQSVVAVGHKGDDFGPSQPGREVLHEEPSHQHTGDDSQ